MFDHVVGIQENGVQPLFLYIPTGSGLQTPTSILVVNIPLKSKRVYLSKTRERIRIWMTFRPGPTFKHRSRMSNEDKRAPRLHQGARKYRGVGPDRFRQKSFFCNLPMLKWQWEDVLQAVSAGSHT